jgi:uncharacterized protein (TIGR03032 family)
MDPQAETPNAEKPVEKMIEVAISPEFPAWMAQAGGSVIITTYQADKVILAGWNGRQVTLLPRHFDRPMGLTVRGRSIALATRREIWMFGNAPFLAPHYPEPDCKRYDALFLPRATHITGELNVHDLAFGTEGLWFVNTRFSCLSLLTPEYSFLPKWQPKFISELVPEDRCHLNGLVLQNGKPKYVTALGTADRAGAWRENKASGGVLMEVDSKEIIMDGLCMPHTPRYHNGKWWLLNSGAGEFLQIVPERSEKTVVCALPGYLRGLCFVGNRWALIGISLIREKHMWAGLAVQKRFEHQLLCGVAVVDLNDGRHVATLQFTQGAEELYDVQFLPGILRPSILNLSAPVAYEGVTAPAFDYWIKPAPEKAGADGQGQPPAGPNAAPPPGK